MIGVVATSASPAYLAIESEIHTHHLLETDVVVEGAPQRLFEVVRIPAAPALSTRPVLMAGTRVFLGQDGLIRICPPPDEPELRAKEHVITVRRLQRVIRVEGPQAPMWTLLAAMDGRRTAAEIISASTSQQTSASFLLGLLNAAVALDCSRRATARFIHSATKKGVLPGAGLEVGRVLELVTDGQYRLFPEAPRVPLNPGTPRKLQTLAKLLRQRRSLRRYTGKSMTFVELSALLRTACGITGSYSWAGRNVKLRAYPSSGGLFAVEIYVVAAVVEGLRTGVYHYVASDDTLEAFGGSQRVHDFMLATLPSEREMVRGVSVTICLTAAFPRHELKYGEGGYRMLVAEAGHISQNLILAATALGLRARPFGGVFDQLANQALGLNDELEQFLLAVIVGHAEWDG